MLSQMARAPVVRLSTTHPVLGPLCSTFWALLLLVTAVTYPVATIVISVLQIRITLNSEWSECYKTPSSTASPPK